MAKNGKRKNPQNEQDRNVKARSDVPETIVQHNAPEYMTVINRASSDPDLAQVMLKTASAAKVVKQIHEDTAP
ncbi:hypothetical protein V8E36_007656 [Tilletia maclaganii]